MSNLISLSSVMFIPGQGQGYREALVSFFGMARAAGFDGVDLNLADFAREGFALSQDNWENWIDHLGEAAAQAGLALPQAHGLVYRSIDSTNPFLPDRPWFEEKIRRSILAAKRLQVPWLVLHPTDFVQDLHYDFQKNRSHNLHYWQPFIELAKKSGVGIAFENLYPSGSRLKRYCSDYEELIDLADSFKDLGVGICWDTGHALCAQQNQPEALRAIGQRLKATHLHDNQGRNRQDQHLFPYQGVADWPGILLALKDIRYPGALSLESKFESDRVPEALQMPLVQLAGQIGRHLAAQLK